LTEIDITIFKHCGISHFKHLCTLFKDQYVTGQMFDPFLSKILEMC